jgi:[ribosomal protein S5]-alanine N-acetyltransferase
MNDAAPIRLDLRPCKGEPELSDPTFTGEFAEEMAQVATQTHTPPWCGFVAWRDGRPIGFGGFKGSPDSAGVVEIGYLTFPATQRQGVATAVTAAMVHLARQQGACAVLAHTLCEPNASTRVLEKNGFTRDGFGEDEDVGIVWRWRLEL